MVLPVPNFITAEEYLAFETASAEKHEYADGRIYSMAGAGIPHNFIVANLLREIGAFLKNKDCHVLPKARQPYI
jgi:Uma2 family endonuclease